MKDLKKVIKFVNEEIECRVLEDSWEGGDMLVYEYSDRGGVEVGVKNKGEEDWDYYREGVNEACELEILYVYENGKLMKVVDDGVLEEVELN